MYIYFVLSLILFFSSNFQNKTKANNQDAIDCKAEIEFKSISTKSDSSEAKLIITSGSEGLIFYCELKNIVPGNFELVSTQKKDSLTLPKLDKLSGEKILTVRTGENIDKGRTLKQDKSKSCKDLESLKNSLFVIKNVDKSEKVVFYSY